LRADRSAEPEADGQRLHERAAQAASLAGHPERALELVESVLRADPAEPFGEALRAQYLWEAGRRQEALAAYSASVEQLSTDPNPAAARTLRAAARCFLLADDYPQARRLADRAVAMARASGADAEESQALYTLGAALAHLGELDGASAALKAVRTLDARRRSQSRTHPRPSRVMDMLAGYWNEATILSRTGKAEESAATALQALERSKELGVDTPWGGRVGTTAADELIELGRWSEARQLLEELVPGAGGGQGAAELHGSLAYVLVLTGNLPAAAQELAVARAGDERSRSLTGRAAIARAAAELGSWTGQLSDAAAELRALSTNPLSDRIPTGRPSWQCLRFGWPPTRRRPHERAERKQSWSKPKLKQRSCAAARWSCVEGSARISRQAD
jgi:tetratricopeptide (TPR) repeat protein